MELLQSMQHAEEAVWRVCGSTLGASARACARVLKSWEGVQTSFVTTHNDIIMSREQASHKYHTLTSALE